MVEETTGTTWVRIQEGPLSVEEASKFLRVESAGAVNIFLGITRRWTRGRETVLLQYECYEAMALAEMVRLLEDASVRWPIERSCLLHRVGEVPAREISVIVGVSTAHRDAAYAASRFLIDELKTHVPIWKKERYADGESVWVEGSRPGNTTQT